jgi:hypothetical protein
MSKRRRDPRNIWVSPSFLLAAVFEEHVRFLYKTWEEIETSAESILRASLITGFPSEKHWNRDRRIIVEPAAPLCFSAGGLSFTKWHAAGMQQQGSNFPCLKPDRHKCELGSK